MKICANFFDLEKVVEYFKSGELAEWLADRFYDDEADAIENISADDRNLSQKICIALGVESDDDVEFIQRLREKKKFLMEKTDDENIIENAATTALNQDDLANLLHMDYSTIFLCGESFNVPIRVENKKYIGVLSTPKIKIRANSDEELEAKNIVFENCKLAWRKESPIEELKALVQKIFGTSGEWNIVEKVFDGISSSSVKIVSTYDKLDKNEKFAALRLTCQGKYEEHQIAYMQLESDFSAGFAFTMDSFCTGGSLGKHLIKYNEIDSVTTSYRGNGRFVEIKQKNGNIISVGERINMFDGSGLEEKLKKFLDIVKNF